MVIMRKYKKNSKRKLKQRKKQYLIFCLSFLFIEIALICFFSYFLRDNRSITDADVYSIKTEIVQTETTSAHNDRKLYLTTTNGNFITYGSYMESIQHCEELSERLLDDPEIELKVLKNSDFFSMYFMGQVSVVVGIESDTTVYSTVEQYNNYCEENRFFCIVSFVFFEIIIVVSGVYIIIIDNKFVNNR